MNVVLKIFCSMSVSGSLLIAILLLGKRFLKNRVSRQWQYYIWLVVVLRLLIPFGPKTSLLGNAYQAVEQAAARTVSFIKEQASLSAPSVDAEWKNADQANKENDTNQENIENYENAGSLLDESAAVHPLEDIKMLFLDHIWLLWLLVAFGLFIRKATVYQGFLRYIHAGLVPVSDIKMLDQLSLAAVQAGIKKPVELCVNPLVSSPLLIGKLHPCIVLPTMHVSEKDFRYIILHELTHYKRMDLFYKWLVQITVCLHWFNPLVHLMSHEITRACEFSCDEAVLIKIGCGSAQDYGKTLLDAMASVGKYKEHPGAATLSENKQLLKERLGAIMNFKKKSAAMRFLTGILTLCVMFGTAFIGIYPAEASAQTEGKAAGLNKKSTEGEASTHTGEELLQIERFYGAGNVPLFQIAYAKLDDAEKEKWVEKIYADQNIAFFAAAVNLLGEDHDFIKRMAKKIYADENVAFFSALVTHMSEDSLEIWLNRALEDGNQAFQSVLFQALDRDEEKDKQEEKWTKAQQEEYQKAGVTTKGKDYYYKGKLVNVFLDMRPNKSFYTLNMNPAGTVNIKIVRGKDGKITGVSYLTEAEILELFGDEDDTDDVRTTTIPVNLKKVKSGEIVWLGEYTLSKGDKIRYDVLAKKGTVMQIGFAKTSDKRLNTTYYFVHSKRQKGEKLTCTADFTAGPPAKDGTYRLFLRAADGALKNVKGEIEIVPADES